MLENKNEDNELNREIKFQLVNLPLQDDLKFRIYEFFTDDRKKEETPDAFLKRIYGEGVITSFSSKGEECWVKTEDKGLSLGTNDCKVTFYPWKKIVNFIKTMIKEKCYINAHELENFRDIKYQLGFQSTAFTYYYNEQMDLNTYGFESAIKKFQDCFDSDIKELIETTTNGQYHFIKSKVEEVTNPNPFPYETELWTSNWYQYLARIEDDKGHHLYVRAYDINDKNWFRNIKVFPFQKEYNKYCNKNINYSIGNICDGIEEIFKNIENIDKETQKRNQMNVEKEF